MVLGKNNTTSGKKDCKEGVVFLGTTHLKCSRHLALQFFKVVWLKTQGSLKDALSFCIFSQFLTEEPAQIKALVISCLHF